MHSSQAARAIYLINQVIVADWETPLRPSPARSLSFARSLTGTVYVPLTLTLLMLGHLLCE